MTLINQKRWNKFRATKSAYYSLILFSIIFILSMFAEFIANDKPLLIHFDNKYYFPIINDYSEKTFGGDFESSANYKDEYLQELIHKSKDGYMVFPIIPFSYDSIIYDLKSPAPTSPDNINILGTDDQGRDILARLIYGFRISVLFGLSLSILSSIIGIVVGSISGYYGGWVDILSQRGIEIVAGLPILFLLIIVSNFIEPDFWWLLFLMLLFSWINVVSLVRAEFLRARNMEYVLSAKALGQSDTNIIFSHILPNALVSTLALFPFMINSSVVMLTSLDFLGFGMPPDSASLGELLSQGKNNIHAPWIGISVFVTLTTMLSLIIFIGEGVRDALDERFEKL